MTDIFGVIYGGQKMEVCDLNSRGMLTNEFSKENTYESGDFCIYKNVLYKFAENKEAGEWDPSAVKTTNVLEEICELRKMIADINTDLPFKAVKTSSDVFDFTSSNREV